jgi:hypothetical protein
VVDCVLLHPSPAPRAGPRPRAPSGRDRIRRRAGAEWLEGYPKDVSERAAGAAAAYPGVPGLFEKAGFEEVVRRKPSGANRPRPIMRYRITARDRTRSL